MFSSTSGIGRLLSSATASISSQSSRTQRHLESITEESVTYDLLYPDSLGRNDGRHHAYPIKYGDPASVAAAARSADDRGGLDIQASRDVRYMIAQKANDFNRVLFDTHPPTSYPGPRSATPTSPEANAQLKENRFTGGLGSSSRVSRSRTAPHSRQTSVTQPAQSILRSPSSPISAHAESGPLYANTQPRSIPRPTTSEGESLQSKVAREEREETEDILSCMFGASGFPSTSSTKVHVKPYTAQSRGSSRPLSPNDDFPFSPRHFEPPKSFLSRSMTAENLPMMVSATSSVTEHQMSRRQSSYLLVTKLFSIDLRDEELEPADCYHRSGPGARSGKLRHGSLPGATNASRNQLRTPVYAVAVIIYLPLRSQWVSGRTSAQPSPIVGLSPRASFGSNDSRQTAETSGNELDDRIDRLMGHLSLMLGTLSLLEGSSRAHIKGMLVNLYTELNEHARPRLQLESSALQSHTLTQELIEALTRRLALALRIRPVISGQDRWTIWRSVARGVCQPSLAQDPYVMLSSLLSTFLAGHTSWVVSHASRDYRRQIKNQKRPQRKTTDTGRCRTVIVSVDKMMARRIVFFLSAFLPSNRKATPSQQRSPPTLSAPPSSLPSGPADPHLNAMRHLNKPNKQVHLAERASAAQGRDSEESTRDATPSHKRRTSDALSMRSLAMPIIPSGTRKSSITTTSTIMPDPQVAIPVFSDLSPDLAFGKNAADPRPGSSGSLAALSLQRTLSRSGSNDRSNSSIESHVRTGWGSVRSGFWGSRRGSSTENSEVMASSGEGLGISGVSHGKSSNGPINKLSQMVEEVDFDARARESSSSSNVSRDPKLAPRSSSPRGPQIMQQPPRSIPQSSPPEMYPLSLSSGNIDGVVDVQLSSPAANISSLPCSYTCPASEGPFRDSLNEILSAQAGNQSISKEPDSVAPPHRHFDPTINVAGWLRAYHPDFALQAIRPYDTLKAEIKYSMRCSSLRGPSNTNASDDPSESSEWTTITTTHLIDFASTILTILTLRRRNPHSPHHALNALQHYPANPSDEIFIEENIPLMDPSSADPVIAKALEQLIGHAHLSQPSSRIASRAPSRAPSPPRAATSAVEQSSLAGGQSQVPRSTPHLLGEGGGLAMGRQGGAGTVGRRGGGRHEECGRVMHGALKKIVREVVREVEEEGNGPRVGKKQESGPRNGKRGNNLSDDKIGGARMLREAVAGWVIGVRAYGAMTKRRASDRGE